MVLNCHWWAIVLLVGLLEWVDLCTYLSAATVLLQPLEGFQVMDAADKKVEHRIPKLFATLLLLTDVSKCDRPASQSV